jgi:hypothetical protein
MYIFMEKVYVLVQGEKDLFLGKDAVNGTGLHLSNAKSRVGLCQNQKKKR